MDFRYLSDDARRLRSGGEVKKETQRVIGVTGKMHVRFLKQEFYLHLFGADIKRCFSCIFKEEPR